MLPPDAPEISLAYKQQNVAKAKAAQSQPQMSNDDVEDDWADNVGTAPVQAPKPAASKPAAPKPATPKLRIIPKASARNIVRPLPHDAKDGKVAGKLAAAKARQARKAQEAEAKARQLANIRANREAVRIRQEAAAAP